MFEYNRFVSEGMSSGFPEDNIYSILADRDLPPSIVGLAYSKEDNVVCCLSACNSDNYCVTAVYDKVSLKCTLFNVYVGDVSLVFNQNSVVYLKEEI